MRSIDIHAHLTAQCYLQAVVQGKAWHGLKGKREARNPRAWWTPEQRIADMDSLGVEVQVVSTTASFYCYDLNPSVTTAIARDCNDKVCRMTKEYSARFAGFCTLPMQDMKAAIAELERGMVQLGLKGVMIKYHVNGHTPSMSQKFYPSERRRST